MSLSRLCAIGRATLQTVGHASCIGILCSTSAVTGLLTYVARCAVKGISFVTGAVIEQDLLVPHRERYLTFQKPMGAEGDHASAHPLLAYRPGTGGDGRPAEEPFQVLDEAQTLAKVKAHYAEKKALPKHFGDEEALTELAKRFIAFEFGCLDESLLADDFQFVFPVVGPLEKAEFVEAFSSFKVRDAFPNARSNFYNFKIDPLEPNRLWALSRGCFVQEGTMNFGPQAVKPKDVNPKVNLPPQCFSFSFDDQGKCYKLTGGYCVDRAVGDTEGLGGMFGILHALGAVSLPFPEGRPWTKRTRSLNWEALSLRAPQIVKDWRRALGNANSSKTCSKPASVPIKEQ